MNSAPPRLRPDLEIKPQPATDGPVYVLKDPLSGDFYRLREAEYFIARQFDGHTPLEAIRERAETQFGATLPPKTLSTFVRVLIHSHLLEGSETKGATRGRVGGFVRGNPLYLRFKLCDPDGLLARLVPRLEFLFTPWFLAFSGALILLALGTTITRHDVLAVEIQKLVRLESLPLILLVLFAQVSVHEFAHGLTCKRYGGEVHEMGFMLLYFQPALYCNVSDAWLFPERSKRLWVGFAGPYVELTLWAAATLLWSLTDPETALHGLALIVAGGSGFKTLLNFNPLLKFDGYYLLSDALDVPNLRSKSFRYIGALMKRLVGRPRDRVLDAEPRLRRIYLAYGLAAFTFSYSALAVAIVIVGDYFVESRGPLSVLLACGLLVFKIRSRIQRLFGSRRKAARGTEPVRLAAAGEPVAAAGQPKPGGAPAQQGGSWWRAARPWVLFGTVAAAAAAALFTVRLELRIGGPFDVLPQENSDVRSPLEQILAEIDVEEGQIVRAGERVARLDDRPLLADLATTEAGIEEARANLRKLQVGPTPAEIEVARSAVVKGQDSQMYATRRADKLAILYGQGLASQKDLEDAQELAAAATNERAEADSRLHLLEAGTRPEEIAATRAKLDQLEAQRRYLEEQRALLDIVSPVAGVVATPTRQLKELRHQLVKKGDLILKVYDISTVTAQIFVSERELDGVAVGQRVELRARAYPGRTFHGTVTSIATSAQGSSGTAAEAGVLTAGSVGSDKSILVTTQIDNRSLLLKPEMTGQAKIFCGPRRVADLVARRAALTFKVALWSWW